MAEEEGPGGGPVEGAGGGAHRRRNRQRPRRLRTAAGRGSVAALGGVGRGGWRIGMLIGLLGAWVRRVEVRVAMALGAAPDFLCTSCSSRLFV